MELDTILEDLMNNLQESLSEKEVYGFLQEFLKGVHIVNIGMNSFVEKLEQKLYHYDYLLFASIRQKERNDLFKTLNDVSPFYEAFKKYFLWFSQTKSELISKTYNLVDLIENSIGVVKEKTLESVKNQGMINKIEKISEKILNQISNGQLNEAYQNILYLKEFFTNVYDFYGLELPDMFEISPDIKKKISEIECFFSINLYDYNTNSEDNISYESLNNSTNDLERMIHKEISNYFFQNNYVELVDKIKLYLIQFHSWSKDLSNKINEVINKESLFGINNNKNLNFKEYEKIVHSIIHELKQINYFIDKNFDLMKLYNDLEIKIQKIKKISSYTRSIQDLANFLESRKKLFLSSSDEIYNLVRDLNLRIDSLSSDVDKEYSRHYPNIKKFLRKYFSLKVNPLLKEILPVLITNGYGAEKVLEFGERLICDKTRSLKSEKLRENVDYFDDKMIIYNNLYSRFLEKSFSPIDIYDYSIFYEYLEQDKRNIKSHKRTLKELGFFDFYYLGLLWSDRMQYLRDLTELSFKKIKARQFKSKFIKHISEKNFDSRDYVPKSFINLFYQTFDFFNSSDIPYGNSNTSLKNSINENFKKYGRYWVKTAIDFIFLANYSSLKDKINESPYEYWEKLWYKEIVVKPYEKLSKHKNL